MFKDVEDAIGPQTATSGKARWMVLFDIHGAFVSLKRTFFVLRGRAAYFGPGSLGDRIE